MMVICFYYRLSEVLTQKKCYKLFAIDDTWENRTQSQHTFNNVSNQVKSMKRFSKFSYNKGLVLHMLSPNMTFCLQFTMINLLFSKKQALATKRITLYPSMYSLQSLRKERYTFCLISVLLLRWNLLRNIQIHLIGIG